MSPISAHGETSLVVSPGNQSRGNQVAPVPVSVPDSAIVTSPRVRSSEGKRFKNSESNSNSDMQVSTTSRFAQGQRLPARVVTLLCCEEEWQVGQAEEADALRGPAQLEQRPKRDDLLRRGPVSELDTRPLALQVRPQRDLRARPSLLVSEIRISWRGWLTPSGAGL